MSRRHSFTDRRSTIASSNTTDRSSTNRGVLRQFRPGISDAWLNSSGGDREQNNVGERDTSALRRIATSRPLTSHGGVVNDNRRAFNFDGGNPAGSQFRPRRSPTMSDIKMSAAGSSSGGGRLVCPECLVTVDGSVGLRAHLQRRHLDSSTILKCPHCAEVIKHMTNLHRHIRVRFSYSNIFSSIYFYNNFEVRTNRQSQTL